MSVLVYIDHSEGTIKKNSLEAATYAAAVGKILGTDAFGLILGNSTSDLSAMGKFGLKKIFSIQHTNLKGFDAQVYGSIIAEAVKQIGADTLIFSNSISGKALAGLTAGKLRAGLVSGAVALPEINNGFTVKKSVFSGKAFAKVSIHSALRVISLNPNAFTITEMEGTAEVSTLTIDVPAPKVHIQSTEKITGSIPLSEAELVVSAGRGLKGPENWGMVEELAGLIGAATACSRAVADVHWRPHHEHVGQTGLAIAPNLYIAIGISGAIQHLAGVNRSKTIVVINKDPEAPFFKAADYGIVGDAFEVVPKMIEEIKKLKEA
jgi:electron transfer flavoprotein alpha subunit